MVDNFFDKSIDEVMKLLKTSKNGLSTSQADQRLHKYGLNELEVGEGPSPWKILLSQFKSPLVWILIVALVISWFLGEAVDVIVIGIIIVVNAVLGFSQEYRAEKAIDALRKMASPQSKVIRNGKDKKIDSKYLVPGDVIILETGDKIPADSRLFEVYNLETQEASLTGESQPIVKTLKAKVGKTVLGDRTDMVYASTIVTKGRAKAVVVHTGMTSEVGKIATLIKEADETMTPLQKKLENLGKNLTWLVVGVAVITFLAGLLFDKDATTMFLTAIALAVAAIPEGLPAVITISLAIGVQRMIKRNALVRKLPSVETLGSVNVICTDKTGTLTHNEMTVTKLYANHMTYEVTGTGYDAAGEFHHGKEKVAVSPFALLLKCGFLCNDAKFELKKGNREVMGDPTEAALIVSAEKAGIKVKEKRVNEIPFSSERKMMTTLHQTAKSVMSFTKGAPDIVLEQCDKILVNGKVSRLDRKQKKQILQQNEEFAGQALRVLGFAYKENATVKNAETNMTFIGLQAMIDPPRDEVRDSIKKCKEAGLRVIMITGDHLTTAKAIAERLGITGDAITGAELSGINLKKKIKDIGIFARVNPKDKLDIVEALRKTGHTVAMTGDGVNDSPALKKADIGISMGISGTDVAKEASDMILTDDNFTSIVNAVEEGRGIFDNIRKFVNYLLSSNLGEILVIFLATIMGMPLPLTAIQILWVNLVTDGLPAVALSFDPREKGIMKQQPRKKNEGIINRKLGINIVVLGTLIGIGTLILFWLYVHGRYTDPAAVMKAQTIAFTALVVFEVVRLQLIRDEYKLGLFSNKLLVGAVAISLGLQLLVIYTPLNSVFKVVPLGVLDWVWLLVAAGVLIVATKVLAKVIKRWY
jgi:P-type Ca2+ transporter type 2C